MKFIKKYNNSKNLFFTNKNLIYHDYKYIQNINLKHQLNLFYYIRSLNVITNSTNYYDFLNKYKHKTTTHRLNKSSYLKKFYSKHARHGKKLSVLTTFTTVWHAFFLFIYKPSTTDFLHYNTFIYNINNYKWLRNITTLLTWSYSWLTLLIKYTLKRKATKAGKKKLIPATSLDYIQPLKRPLLFFYYIEKLIKLAKYKKYNTRVSSVMYDIFLNYKNSNIYDLKAATYKKYIKKSLGN